MGEAILELNSPCPRGTHGTNANAATVIDLVERQNAKKSAYNFLKKFRHMKICYSAFCFDKAR